MKLLLLPIVLHDRVQAGVDSGVVPGHHGVIGTMLLGVQRLSVHYNLLLLLLVVGGAKRFIFHQLVQTHATRGHFPDHVGSHFLCNITVTTHAAMVNTHNTLHAHFVEVLRDSSQELTQIRLGIARSRETPHLARKLLARHHLLQLQAGLVWIKDRGWLRT